MRAVGATSLQRKLMVHLATVFVVMIVIAAAVNGTRNRDIGSGHRH